MDNTEVKATTQQSASPTHVPNPEKEKEECKGEKETPDLDLGDKTSGEITAAQNCLEIHHEREGTSSV